MDEITIIITPGELREIVAGLYDRLDAHTKTHEFYALRGDHRRCQTALEQAETVDAVIGKLMKVKEG